MLGFFGLLFWGGLFVCLFRFGVFFFVFCFVCFRCLGLGVLFHFLFFFFLSCSVFSSSKTKFNIRLTGFGRDPQHAHSPVLIRERDCWLTVFHKDQIHTCLYL